MADNALPEGCPPEGHVASDGTFYRLVPRTFKPGEPTDKGCWRKPHRGRGPDFGRIDDCFAHGLSLFEDLDKLRAARELSPWAAGKSIAAVELEPEMGRTLKTPSELADGHHDWWTTPYEFVPEAVVIEGPLDVVA